MQEIHIGDYLRVKEEMVKVFNEEVGDNIEITDFMWYEVVEIWVNENGQPIVAIEIAENSELQLQLEYIEETMFRHRFEKMQNKD